MFMLERFKRDFLSLLHRDLSFTKRVRKLQIIEHFEAGIVRSLGLDALKYLKQVF